VKKKGGGGGGGGGEMEGSRGYRATNDYAPVEGRRDRCKRGRFGDCGGSLYFDGVTVSSCLGQFDPPSPSPAALGVTGDVGVGRGRVGSGAGWQEFSLRSMPEIEKILPVWQDLN